MKKKILLIGLILAIASVAGYLLSHIKIAKENNTVTIIGGADGPTSIFLAGKLGNSSSDMNDDPVDEVESLSDEIMEENPEEYISDMVYSIELSADNATELTQDMVITPDMYDKPFLMCKSENGKYEVYGFLTSEYGFRGIVIRNIIDGEGNDNLFYDSWTNGKKLPEIKEIDEYTSEFTFSQIVDGKEVNHTVTLDSYDTGTVNPRDCEKSFYLIED